MSSGLVLREFRYPEDYDAALDIWRVSDGVRVGPSDTPEEIRRKLERDPDLFLVAEENAQVIGTIIGAFDGRRGMIYHLAVHPGFRKRGIGAALLKEVEARLIAKGCCKCYLLMLRENDAAGFYERLGWNEMTHDRIFGKEFK